MGSVVCNPCSSGYPYSSPSQEKWAILEEEDQDRRWGGRLPPPGKRESEPGHDLWRYVHRASRETCQRKARQLVSSEYTAQTQFCDRIEENWSRKCCNRIRVPTWLCITQSIDGSAINKKLSPDHKTRSALTRIDLLPRVPNRRRLSTAQHYSAAAGQRVSRSANGARSCWWRMRQRIRNNST